MLQLKNIYKEYGGGDTCVPVLYDITLSINDGEFVAIMGPSGSGKSTLMHILGCLDIATRGNYTINNIEVGHAHEEKLEELRRNEIGFVFQSFNLLPRRTVLENVMLPLVYAHVPFEKRESRAIEALAKAGFDTSRIHHKSNQISGGQAQRVAIARALVNNPHIILADEPTGNLDSKTGEIVLGTFQSINKREKATVILITHERDVAEHADRIIFLKDGKIASDEKNKHIRKTIYYDAH
ncbi:MAG: ABC transporter ATP-binding protein [Alphaproteobacteria bacterium]|nr:ABC transporter ATP-binding protein [Alphaproteobacteria bacterium]